MFPCHWPWAVVTIFNFLGDSHTRVALILARNPQKYHFPKFELPGCLNYRFASCFISLCSANL